MARDFTYDIYERLLDAVVANDYRTLTVREYVDRETLPERFLVVRHDIDRKPENALDLARLEAEAGVSASYYFRAIDKTFKPELMREVSELGHEVRYHYEDVDAVEGDTEAARESFAENLRAFRDHVDVDTVSMHGNPLTPYDNRDLWEDAAFGEYDLAGEVYLSVDFTEVVYFSDTNRTWYDETTVVDDWPVGPSAKPEQVESTEDLIDLVESRRHSRLYLLVHPNRWADSYPEWVGEVAKDAATNVGKYGLWLVRSGGDGQAESGSYGNT
jgi:hypothetical protein